MTLDENTERSFSGMQATEVGCPASKELLLPKACSFKFTHVQKTGLVRAVD